MACDCLTLPCPAAACSAMLLKLFLAPVLPGSTDDYQHVATILPNVTRFQAGRRLLLQPGRGLLQALVSQLRSPCELRRRGCAGAIKNCCFSCEEDDTLAFLLEDDVKQVGARGACGILEEFGELGERVRGRGLRGGGGPAGCAAGKRCQQGLHRLCVIGHEPF